MIDSKRVSSGGRNRENQGCPPGKRIWTRGHQAKPTEKLYRRNIPHRKEPCLRKPRDERSKHMRAEGENRSRPVKRSPWKILRARAPEIPVYQGPYIYASPLPSARTRYTPAKVVLASSCYCGGGRGQSDGEQGLRVNATAGKHRCC